MSYSTKNTTASNISNIRYNLLLALEPTDKRMGNNVVWKCLCDCGNICYVDTGSLKTGNTKSCGCHKRETVSKNIELVNRISRLPKGDAGRNQLYSRYKREALKRNLTFELDKNVFSILTKQNCHYCGREPMNEYRNKGINGSYIYNGIDRKDNKVGYSEENCVPCCWDCNQMKADRTEEEFILHISKIISHRI